MSTEPGGNYAETSAKEERAWKQLCRVHGNSTPKPDFNRIEFLLTLCEKYQGHNKTKRTLLKELHRKNVTLPNVPFNVARPIIGTAANFEDEINAQIDAGPVPKAAAVNTVGADTNRNEKDKNGGTRRRAGADVETCNICAKPGHNARDCLLFMKREGTCGHWSMHSLGIYRTGCEFGSRCVHKHERPGEEPPENKLGRHSNAPTPRVHQNIDIWCFR